MSRVRPADRPGHRETGAVGLLTVLGGMLMALVAVVIVGSVADLAVTRHRAATAADAAALAAAGASPLAGGGGNPHAAARELARANGATLDRLEDHDWPVRVTVRVTAETRNPLMRAALSPVPAQATAELVAP